MKKRTKLTIKKLSRQTKENKEGKKYETVGILTEEMGDTWINGWGSGATDSWQEGDIIEIDLFKQEYNGNIQVRFSIPSLREKVDKLEKRIEKLENNKQNISTTPVSAQEKNQKSNDIDLDNIPF